MSMELNPVRRMVVDLGVRTPMRDGIELVGDLYLPAAEGKFPAVLFRCPYDKADSEMGSYVICDPGWLARQGFAVLVQDTRGRGGSEGEFDIIEQEVDDGYDTVEWVAAQPWCSGAVGIYGSSYMGITSYQATAAQPPHLRAAVAFVATGDRVDSRATTGGMLDSEFTSWFALACAIETVGRKVADPEKRTALQGRLIGAILDPVGTRNAMPLAGIDVISDPTYSPIWADQLSEPSRKRPASGKLLGETLAIGDVALLHITGYRDFLSVSSFRIAEALAGNPNHRFVAGPWTHRGVYSGTTGMREFPETSSPAGPLGWGPLIAAWFDIYLRGGTGATNPSGLPWFSGDAVRYYIEGENRWANAASWPPPGEAVEWRLDSDGDARTAKGNGRLLAPGALPAATGFDRFTADPKAPFPTCGGALGMPSQGPEGVQDHRLVDGRPDVLVYTSEVLTAPVRIVGAPVLALQFGSSAPDADICVKLINVEPSGIAANVAEGFLRTRYRNGGAEDWLEPGTATEVQVRLHNTAHVFFPGHRIRVMVAGANFPRLSRNLHTETVPEFGTLDEAVAATHEVHHGPALASRLILREARD